MKTLLVLLFPLLFAVSCGTDSTFGPGISAPTGVADKETETITVTETKEVIVEHTVTVTLFAELDALEMTAEDTALAGCDIPRFSLDGTYTNGESHAIPYANWTSSNPDVAVVDPFGKVHTLSDGTVTLTATVDGKSVSHNLTVSRVNGDLNGDCVVNNGDMNLISAHWLEAGGGIADANKDGIVNIQDSALVASLWNNHGPNPLTIVDIKITPASTSSISLCSKKPFKVVAEFSDGFERDYSDSVQWSTSNTSNATVDKFGVVRPIKDGSIQVYAAIDALGTSYGVNINRLKGDVNGDGFVDISDQQGIAVYWLQSDPYADLNHDGVVDISDIQQVAQYWMQKCP